MSAPDLRSAPHDTSEGVADEANDRTNGDRDGTTGDAVTDASGPATGEAAPDAATGQTEHSKDVVFDILRNERRRQVLQFLREHPRTTLSDLAEHVASLENDKPIHDLTSSERKRVYVGLYQCHLPKMDDVGVIDYDRSRGTIGLRNESSPYFVYLDVDPTSATDDDPRGRLTDWMAPLTSRLGLR